MTFTAFSSDVIISNREVSLNASVPSICQITTFFFDTNAQIVDVSVGCSDKVICSSCDNSALQAVAV